MPTPLDKKEIAIALLPAIKKLIENQDPDAAILEEFGRWYRSAANLKQPPAGASTLDNLFSIAAKESDRPPAKAPENPGAINWGQNTSMVSKYFTVREVTNGDPARLPGGNELTDVLRLAKELDKVREVWGAPIGVTSWYRPYEINLAVGGVPNSSHILGGAADIYTMDGRDSEFEGFLDGHWGGGVGYGVASGRGFTHVDLYGGGSKAGPGGFDSGEFSVRWTY